MINQHEMTFGRMGVVYYPSHQEFPSVGNEQYLYLDAHTHILYMWTTTSYHPLTMGFKQWLNNTHYVVGDIVIHDNTLFIAVKSHVSTTKDIYQQDNCWRNLNNHGRVDVFHLTLEVNMISEMNCNDFNIIIQSNDIPSKVSILLPDPKLRSGQVLTYAFSAGSNVTNTAEVTFLNFDQTEYTFISKFNIPNASQTNQGIRLVKFISTSQSITDDTAMWFPICENFRGATEHLNGSNGYVPAPQKQDNMSFLKGNGEWGSVCVDWYPNTIYTKGTIILNGKTMFLVQSTMISCSTCFNDDLTANKPLLYVAGDQYIYHIKTDKFILDKPVNWYVVDGDVEIIFLPKSKQDGKQITIFSKMCVTIVDLSNQQKHILSGKKSFIDITDQCWLET